MHEIRSEGEEGVWRGDWAIDVGVWEVGSRNVGESGGGRSVRGRVEVGADVELGVGAR